MDVVFVAVVVEVVVVGTEYVSQMVCEVVVVVGVVAVGRGR